MEKRIAPCHFVNNAVTNNMYMGYFVLHDINGIIIMVMSLSRLFSRVRVAIIAGTLQPNPIIIGITDFPCSPILCMILSIRNATRAIYPVSSINERNRNRIII